jgi:transcriptional regulator with XRE-family HTH domain
MTQDHLETRGDGEREETADEREDRLLDEDAQLDDDRQGESWATAVVSTVAAEVCRRRTELGLSQQELAEQCTALGYPIPRNVLANLESGRRTSLQVVELLVLAEALRCIPVALLFPVGHREAVHALPGSPWSALLAADWFSGLTPDNEDNSLFLYRNYSEQWQARAATNAELRELRVKLKSSVHLSEREELQRDIALISEKRDRLGARLAHVEAVLQADGLLPPDESIPWPNISALRSEETT